jgi:hypothetical protein
MFASLTSTFLFSLFFVLSAELEGPATEENLGHLIKGILMWMLFSGVIIFTYGTFISTFLEFIYGKMKKKRIANVIFYIAAHGFFGAAFGAGIGGFANSFSLIGALFFSAPAMIYALADLWMMSRIKKGKVPGYLSIIIVIVLLMFFVVSIFLEN